MSVSTRRLASLAVVGAALLLPHQGGAQVSLFQACTQGPLADCAIIRLTSQLGATLADPNLLQIGIQNDGSSAGFATSIDYLVFLTGQPAVPDADDVFVPSTPTAEGGAVITDASPWSIFESGDAVVLAPDGDNGVGGCDTAAPDVGFGQMATTCGSNSFITFSFFTPRAFDPSQFVLADMEIAGPGGLANSCVDAASCTIQPIATPEPGTLVLMLTGLSGLVAVRPRRRTVTASHPVLAAEV